MESSINTRIEAELALRFEDRMDVGLISTGLVSLWQEIDAVLYPIIGQRGVAALYQRSLYLTAQTYPWLTSSRDSAQTSIDLAHLKSLLIRQQAADLILAGTLLFKTFHELLVSLVGPSLTERLLRSVGGNFFSGATPQDCS